MKYTCSNITANAIASTDSVWTTEMTVDTALAAATAINTTITTDNAATLSITTDHSNYIDYSHLNSPSWQWDGSSWDGNNYLNKYIYNPQYFVVPSIYNIPSYIFLAEGTIVYATDTNTLYVYHNGRFDAMDTLQSTYTITNGNNTNITVNNKQKNLVEENNLILLYFF